MTATVQLKRCPIHGLEAAEVTIGTRGTVLVCMKCVVGSVEKIAARAGMVCCTVGDVDCEECEDPYCTCQECRNRDPRDY